MDVYSGIRCELAAGRILRQVPGRRIVYEGQCGRTEAIIKVFLSPAHGRRHWTREKKGLEELAKRGIRTATIIAGGVTPEGDYTLALEKVENANDIHSIVARNNDRDCRNEILNKTLELLAQMHNAGVIQRDLHLGNFLWDGTHVYALDPAQMKFCRGAVSMNRSLRQVALLAGGFVISGPAEMSELLGAYFQKRRWPLSDALIERFEHRAKQSRHRSLERYLKKTLRTCTHYIRYADRQCRGVFDRAVFEHLNLSDFATGIDTAVETGNILKPGNTCFVSKVKLNGRDIVIKRYNHKGLWHALRHTIKGSRAKRCWLFGHRLTGLGIASARPLAYIEKRKYGVVTESYIVNEFIEGPASKDFLCRTDLPELKRKEVTAKIQTLVSQLAENLIVHNDLKHTNILIQNSCPVLIDLDSIKRLRCRWAMSYYKHKMEKNIRDRIYNGKNIF